jgi:hypothetical protein
MENNNVGMPPSTGQRKSWEVEYQVGLELFKMQNTQAWQTFSITSTLALLGLAFIGQFKASSGEIETWPVTVVVGAGMIIILIGWLVLANRWWAFAQQELYRMREIERDLGLYMVRQGTWLREPGKLDPAEQKELAENPEAKEKCTAVRARFKSFPKLCWQQKTLAFVMVFALILIWLATVVTDFFGLW